MRSIVMGIVLLAITGCAASIWPPAISFGGATYKTGCDEEGKCSTVVESQPVGNEVLDFVARIVDAIPGAEIGAAAPATIHHTHATEE